ncbi:MAG: acyl carrier protein [Planctomycetota bacterium]
MTRDEIFNKVRTLLVDALVVDEEGVNMQSRLTTDLGAESIDFLDIVFRLSQVFGITIGQGELFPENPAQQADMVKDGKVTAGGLTMLKSKLPHVDFAAFEKDPSVKRVGELFTVEAVVNFVERKLATK